VSSSVDAPFAKRIDGWINPAAFSQAAQFTFGNISRTSNLRGPGQMNCDVSVFKTFAIRERFKAQFRAEMFNISNTPQLGNPGGTLGTGTFGRVTGTAADNRQIQFALKYTF
jgi:hypothetical protein